jgi:hypothetical protein
MVLCISIIALTQFGYYQLIRSIIVCCLYRSVAIKHLQSHFLCIFFTLFFTPSSSYCSFSLFWLGASKGGSGPLDLWGALNKSKHCKTTQECSVHENQTTLFPTLYRLLTLCITVVRWLRTTNLVGTGGAWSVLWNALFSCFRGRTETSEIVFQECPGRHSKWATCRTRATRVIAASRRSVERVHKHWSHYSVKLQPSFHAILNTCLEMPATAMRS